MKREVTLKKIIIWCFFILYILILVNLILFKFTPLEDIKNNINFFSIKHIKYRITYCNFIPLNSVKAYFKAPLNILYLFKNIICPLTLFIPFGFLIPFASKKHRMVSNTVKLIFIFSFIIELSKVIYGLGYFNVDNIIFIIFGGIIGFSYACNMRRKHVKGKMRNKIKYKTVEI
ncbi:VanZ family protein [Hathewaya histolytica]|uniref:VanZ family protein n=1 Tax=Hathewaya histolytica TaxID=1498 RepID=UPI0039ED4C7F